MKTLHLIERVNNVAKVGDIFECWSWDLTDEERTATHLALHRKKVNKAHFAGTIVGFRKCDRNEGRWVIQFKLESRNKVCWTGSSTHMMAYKSLSNNNC